MEAKLEDDLTEEFTLSNLALGNKNGEHWAKLIKGPKLKAIESAANKSLLQIPPAPFKKAIDTFDKKAHSGRSRHREVWPDTGV